MRTETVDGAEAEAETETDGKLLSIVAIFTTVMSLKSTVCFIFESMITKNVTYSK